MIRKHFYLPEYQVKYLESIAFLHETPVSEVIRKIIDKHIGAMAVQSPSKGKRHVG